MKIHCCYRVIPNGEVIHTFIDDVTKVVDLMPESFMNTQDLELAEYNSYAYNGREDDWAAMCEAILLSNKDYAFVVESGTIGYFVLQWDGFWRFLETPMDEKDKGRWSIKPFPGNFTYIGYRPTRLLQYRSCSGIFRLTYDKVDNTVLTNDGILVPAFDVSSLSPIDYNYAGYKEAVSKKHYAVVYRDGHPIFLRRNGNSLEFVE